MELSSATLSSTHSYQILIAEDNPGDVRLIQEALSENQVCCQLHVISDGEKALALLRDNGFESRLDLVVLDLNLPRADGKEILGYLHQNPKFQHVPVIVLSASQAPGEEAEVERLGARRYIRKPVSLQGFLEIGGMIRDVLAS